MYSDLVTAIEKSDLSMAQTSLETLFVDGQVEPWTVHEALFPVVHRVLNPPFINPHLAKMYAINREFVHFLEPADIGLLVRLEIEEYTRREKLPFLGKPVSIRSITDFTQIEKAIAKQDICGTAIAMDAFSRAAGLTQMARRLLLLGSGFLDYSLGHSVSCTAFILREMMHRKDDDPWPALVLLADYFCKGNFQQTSELQYAALSDY